MIVAAQAALPQAIVLRFHSSVEDGLVATALSEANGEVVACYSLQMMHGWLQRHGFSWREGSSGIWHRIEGVR